MQMKEVLISVIMPVYNAERYLESAIISILNQTYKKFEFLIIDDGSKDHSLDIIERYAASDPRIKYRTRPNVGLSKTLNELIDMSSGEYLARMDGDDYSYPDRLAKQLEYMESHTEVAVLGSVIRTTNNGELRCLTQMDQEVRRVRMLFSNEGVAHPTAFMRADFLKMNSLEYNEHFVGSEDYYLWTDILKCGGVIDNLPEVLLDYRITEGQMSSVLKEGMRRLDVTARLNLLEKIGDFSVEQKNTFSDLSMSTRASSADVDVLFDELKKKNQETCFLNQNTLKDELCYQWNLLGLYQVKRWHNFDFFKGKYLKKYLIRSSFPYVYENLKKRFEKKYIESGYI